MAKAPKKPMTQAELISLMAKKASNSGWATRIPPAALKDFARSPPPGHAPNHRGGAVDRDGQSATGDRGDDAEGRAATKDAQRMRQVGQEQGLPQGRALHARAQVQKVHVLHHTVSRTR